MRLQQKRALDYWLGRPVLALFNATAIGLGALMRRDHNPKPIHHVLFVKFQGLGSLIMAKPSLSAFRRHYPDARCILWATPGVAILGRQMPEFDEILVLDDRTLLTAVRSSVKVLMRLWRLRIDWVFDLEVYSRLSSVLTTLTCATNRVGFALEQLRARRVHTHLIYFNRYGYVGDAYARMIGQLLPDEESVDLSQYGEFRFDLSPVSFLPRPYIVFNVHAGELSLERRWPLESFRELIDALLERRPDMTAVLIGHGENEDRYVAGLARTSRIRNLCGQLTLPETVRALAHADLFVTNDSGPFHLALSTQVPIVALFGPTRSDTYLPPSRPRVIALQESVYCSPCVHHWEPPPCDGDNQCMKRLSVARVTAACQALLGLSVESLPASHPTVHSDYYAGLVYTPLVRNHRLPGGLLK